MSDTLSVEAKLDLIEKLVIIIFYGFFSYRMVHAYLDTGNPVLIIFLFDQFLILFFTLIRKKAATISLKASDWIVAVMGSIFPLLMGSLGSYSPVPIQIALPLLLVGISIHLLAKLFLRRSFGAVPARREIKSIGPYRVIRHPMYAGYMIVQFGLFLSGPTFYNFCIILGAWIFYILRIEAEEKILMQDPQYQKLIIQTPYRLIPGVY